MKYKVVVVNRCTMYRMYDITISHMVAVAQLTRTKITTWMSAALILWVGIVLLQIIS